MYHQDWKERGLERLPVTKAPSKDMGLQVETGEASQSPRPLSFDQYFHHDVRQVNLVRMQAEIIYFPDIWPMEEREHHKAR